MKFYILGFALAVKVFSSENEEQGYSLSGLGISNLPSGFSGKSSSSSSSFSSFSSSSSSGGLTSLTSSGGSTSGAGSSTSSSFGSGSSLSSTSFPQVNVASLTSGSSGNLSSNDFAMNTINQAKLQAGTPVRSRQSLFTRFPGIQQLTNFVESGDIAGITRTLQTISQDDSVPCAVKVGYLLNLLNLIRGKIGNSTTVADQLSAVIDIARAQITRIEQEIARLNAQRNQNGTPQLDNKVLQVANRMRQLNQQIRALQVQISPQEIRVINFENQLQSINTIINNDITNLSATKGKAALYDSNIALYQQKLNQARQKRNSILKGITTSQTVIKNNNTKIDEIKLTINDLRAKIRGFRDTIDNLRKQSINLEIDLERARSDFNNASRKDTGFSETLRSLQIRLNSSRQRTPDDVLVRLRTVITNLNNSVPNINNDINRQYYYCFGAGKVDIQYSGSVIVYVVKGQAFGQYLQNAYGQAVGAPRITTGQDMRLQVVNPFSQVWSAKYGYPLAAQGSGFSSGSSFSCSNTMSVTSGSGTINSISGGNIVLTGNDGRTVNLTVGECSRIQSTNSVPLVGQQMFWRGASSAGKFDLYSATCW